MKKIVLNSSAILMVLFFIACGKADSIPETKAFQSQMANVALVANPTHEDDATKLALPSTDGLPLPSAVIAAPDQTFTFEREGLLLSALADQAGNLRILDYPTEWRGRAKLIQYDGYEKSPFSKEHCKEIKKLAEMEAGFLVRTAHHSLIIFELPFFLRSELSTMIRDMRISSRFPSLELVNPPMTILHGELQFKFKEDAISPIVGDINYLNEQLNFRFKGVEDGNGKVLTVISGDILCDLAEGNAEMIMEYPIKGEEKTVKVVYDNLDIESAK